MKDFSLVCPVWHGDIDKVTQTFPSFMEVNPTELVVAVDYTHEEIPSRVGLADRVVEVIENVAKDWDGVLRVVKVKRNLEYKFQQAWVRRKGFLEAKCDTILTSDADLILNTHVYKAVAQVGENNVGFVSLQKFLYPNNLCNLWRCITRTFLMQFFRLHQRYKNRLIRHCPFTGLYAVYRPYWLDSEDEGIKDLVNPKQKVRGEHVSRTMESAFIGEDTYLHDCMIRKHRCVYLSDIGAICLDTHLEDTPDVQRAVAIYHAQRGRTFIGCMLHTILHARWHYLPALIQSKRYLRNKVTRTRLEKFLFGGEGPTLEDLLQEWLRGHSYEPGVSKVMLKHHGKLFVDVGAGIGYYSFLLHDGFDKIFAFEPHPHNYRKMKNFVDELGFHKVKVFSYAISNKAGATELYVADNPPYQGQSSLDKGWVVQLNKNAEPSHIFDVETASLSTVLGNQSVVDLVKVDVEGLEWKVVEGAEKVMPRIKAWMIEVHDLASKIPPIQLHPLQEKMDRMRRLMEGYGYTCQRLGKDHIYCFRDG